jgi:pimeloyl-ACP methyl ester carboxylesterase
MDRAGFATSHIVGNSLGGYVALQLAARGRAESVVAFAPAGGWAPGDDSYRKTLALQAAMQRQLRTAAPHAPAILASAEGRRRVAEYLVTHWEHIPTGLLSHLMLGAAACHAAPALIEYASANGWTLDAAAITCPVRVVWGTDDRLLPWPSAAARYRTDWLPHADWVELEGIGHCPQLDVPVVAAELILGFVTP